MSSHLNIVCDLHARLAKDASSRTSGGRTAQHDIQVVWMDAAMRDWSLTAHPFTNIIYNTDRQAEVQTALCG